MASKRKLTLTSRKKPGTAPAVAPSKAPETVPSVTQLSPQDIAKAEHMQPLQMPEWYAAGAQLIIAGNDAQLVFNKPVMLVAPNNAAVHNLAINMPVGLVRMSLGTLKDLSVLLHDQVMKREKDMGAIETEYTKSRAQQAPLKKGSASGRAKTKH
jgi:hypothetical protein